MKYKLKYDKTDKSKLIVAHESTEHKDFNSEGKIELFKFVPTKSKYNNILKTIALPDDPEPIMIHESFWKDETVNNKSKD